MNRERAKELLPIIEAFADGETIQFLATQGEWEDITTPQFDSSSKYRIKPKPREFRLYPFPDGQWRVETGDKEWTGEIKVREVLDDE